MTGRVGLTPNEESDQQRERMQVRRIVRTFEKASSAAGPCNDANSWRGRKLNHAGKKRRVDVDMRSRSC